MELMDRVSPENVLIAPSILAADFSNLAEELKLTEQAGTDLIHLDIMDGHFVPNISFGPPVVKSIIDKTSLPMEAHLMITDPIKYGVIFADMGVKIITAHIEVLQNPSQWQLFKSKINALVGIAINPPTQIANYEELLENFHLILIMSVHPGFAGQKFIPDVLPKIEKFASINYAKNYNRIIAVDGGINLETAPLVKSAGANMLVMGSAFYQARDYGYVVNKIRNTKRR